ncbi:MAG: metallophosphoesterase [Proteobacteria bacterium]|nr:metallophosphoesterase [Pseudomonadota bacterium]
MRRFQEFRSSPQRHPGLDIPDGLRLYAIGDIHGRLDLLRRLDRLIAADALASPADRRLIVFLGDYVDRGPDSAGVIASLINDRPADVETVFLKGNHEDFMLDAIDGGGKGLTWLMNGGEQTLESYGIDAGPLFDSPERIGEIIRGRLPAAHLGFLRGLKTKHAVGGVYFAHAGVDPDRSLDDQRATDLMWIRDRFLHSGKDLGAVVVHGHTPVLAPEVFDNRINCDTGAYATDRLTAAVLELDQLRFLQT